MCCSTSTKPHGVLELQGRAKGRSTKNAPRQSSSAEPTRKGIRRRKVSAAATSRTTDRQSDIAGTSSSPKPRDYKQAAEALRRSQRAEKAAAGEKAGESAPWGSRGGFFNLAKRRSASTQNSRGNGSSHNGRGDASAHTYRGEGSSRSRTQDFSYTSLPNDKEQSVGSRSSKHRSKGPGGKVLLFPGGEDDVNYVSDALLSSQRSRSAQPCDSSVLEILDSFPTDRVPTQNSSSARARPMKALGSSDKVFGELVPTPGAQNVLGAHPETSRTEITLASNSQDQNTKQEGPNTSPQQQQHHMFLELQMKQQQQEEQYEKHMSSHFPAVQNVQNIQNQSVHENQQLRGHTVDLDAHGHAFQTGRNSATSRRGWKNPYRKSSDVGASPRSDSLPEEYRNIPDCTCAPLTPCETIAQELN